VEGSFDTIALSDVLEMIHTNRGSGTLHLMANYLPLELHFFSGEVIGGGILDWEGLEALTTFPLHPEQGRFRFAGSSLAGTPLMPFKTLVGEWARMNDQWTRFRSLLDSPSRVLDTPRATDPLGVFLGGKSVRAAAKAWNVPLIIAAERAWRGLREGDLSKLRKYAWFALRIRHPTARRTHAGLVDPSDLTVQLDGTRNLGELIHSGTSIKQIRSYLIERISKRELEVPGKGWMLRDLLWEVEKETVAETVS